MRYLSDIIDVSPFKDMYQGVCKLVLIYKRTNEKSA